MRLERRTPRGLDFLLQTPERTWEGGPQGKTEPEARGDTGAIVQDKGGQVLDRDSRGSRQRLPPLARNPWLGGGVLLEPSSGKLKDPFPKHREAPVHPTRTPHHAPTPSAHLGVLAAPLLTTSSSSHLCPVLWGPRG